MGEPSSDPQGSVSRAEDAGGSAASEERAQASQGTGTPRTEEEDVNADTVAPLTRSGCLENAARVLRFAEGETNPVQFDQWTSLAEKWMELGETIGE